MVPPMSFEYASVSASAYDVNSLVGKLNEKAADGWDVVSIVPTGGDVTAFLKREASAASDGEGALADTSETAGTADVGDAAAAAPYGTGTAAAVSEPSGWAAEPTTASDDGGPLPSSTETSWSAGSATVEEEPPAPTEPEPVSETPSSYAGAGSSEPSYSGAAASEPASTTAAAPAAATTSVPTTPAGWYPDPSGRYEMRYWDGDKWTEHVSRQGQTFTDPPVA
jgi:hypothetical protein